MKKLPDDIKKKMAIDRIGRKFIKYLEDNRAKGIIDFQLRIDSHRENPLAFIIEVQQL